MVQNQKRVTNCGSKGLTRNGRPNDGSKTAKRSFKSQVSWFPRKKQPLAWRAGPTRLWVPREKTGAEKEKKNMIEEIKARQTNQEQSKKVSSGQEGAGVALTD